MTGLPPTQTPLWQVSVWVQAVPSLQPVWVQALPSSQGVPLGFCGLSQAPVLGLHVPWVWH